VDGPPFCKEFGKNPCKAERERVRRHLGKREDIRECEGVEWNHRQSSAILQTNQTALLVQLPGIFCTSSAASARLQAWKQKVTAGPYGAPQRPTAIDFL